MLALLTNLPPQYLRAQLGDGVVVMVLGMLVVFLFLTILIGCTKLMSRVLKKFSKEEAPKKSAAPAEAEAKKGENRRIAAAIAAAIDKER